MSGVFRGTTGESMAVLGVRNGNRNRDGNGGFGVSSTTVLSVAMAHTVGCHRAHGLLDFKLQ